MTPATQCTYQWAVVAKPQATSVLYYVRCHNKTRHESGRCWVHVGSSGRYDRRPR